jgi:hypothetical protein
MARFLAVLIVHWIHFPMIIFTAVAVAIISTAVIGNLIELFAHSKKFENSY